MSLKNKAAIVTGGNSGIGMAIALELDKLQRQGLEYGFLDDWSVTTFPVQLPLSPGMLEVQCVFGENRRL